jgi:chloride channel 7
MINTKLLAQDIMAREMVSVPPVVRLRDLFSTLRAHPHDCFPLAWRESVIEGTDGAKTLDLVGVIDRVTLLRLLKFRTSIVTQPDCVDPRHTPPPTFTQEQRDKILEQLEQYPEKVRPSDDQESIFRSFPLHEQETLSLDLRPFMQKNPMVVSADSTLFRAYRVFRTMGLKYLFVAPSQPQVIGIITRKDVTEERARLTLLNKVRG